MKPGADCTSCAKKIDPATDRPVYDRRKWFCSDDCWNKYVRRIFEPEKKKAPASTSAAGPEPLDTSKL